MRSLLLESLKTWKWSKQSLLTRETLNYGSVYQKSVRALIIWVSNLHQRITLLRQSVQDALVTFCPYPGHISYQVRIPPKITDINSPRTLRLRLEDNCLYTPLCTAQQIYATLPLLNCFSLTNWVEFKGLEFSSRLFTEGTAPFKNLSRSLPWTLILWGELVPANFRDLSLSFRLRNV